MYSVQLDIVKSLGMSLDHLYKVVHPFNRANLFYEVCLLAIVHALLTLTYTDTGSLYVGTRRPKTNGRHTPIY